MFFFCIFLTQTSTPMCLIDAEDYSDLPVRQYEEDNVLRELNKSYLGFHQVYQDVGSVSQQPQMQQRLPPVGASRDSSPSSRQASMNTGVVSCEKRASRNDDLIILLDRCRPRLDPEHDPGGLIGGSIFSPAKPLPVFAQSRSISIDSR